MLARIDINQRIEFSVSDDVEPKTVFVLKPLTTSELMSLGDGGTKSDNAFKLMEKSIAEVKNGREFKSVRELLESLPIGVVNELSLKIAAINHLTDAVVKNS